jgi:hypothetical protein
MARSLGRVWPFSWDMLQLVQASEARPWPVSTRPTDFSGFAAACLRTRLFLEQTDEVCPTGLANRVPEMSKLRERASLAWTS